MSIVNRAKNDLNKNHTFLAPQFKEVLLNTKVENILRISAAYLNRNQCDETLLIIDDSHSLRRHLLAPLLRGDPPQCGGDWGGPP